MAKASRSLVPRAMSAMGTIGRPKDAPALQPVHEGAVHRQRVKQEKIPQTRMKKYAVREYTEHIELGKSMTTNTIKVRERLFRRLFPKTLKHPKAEQMRKDYGGLERVPFTSYRAEYGIMLGRLQNLHTHLQYELTHMYQNVHIEQFKDPSLSLTMTNIYFGKWATVTIATNLNRAYAYGKVYTCAKLKGGSGDEGEITVYDAYGKRTEFDRGGFKLVCLALLKAVRGLRRHREDNKDQGQEMPEDTDAEKLLRTISDASREGRATHTVSFADCSIDGDHAFDDLPSGLGDLEAQVDGLNAANPFATTPMAVSEARDAALAVSEQMYHAPEVLDADEIVKPMFSVFIEPWLHHMVSDELLDCLPRSRYWNNRVEYIGMEHTKLFQSCNLPQRPSNLLIDNRSPYPAPPRQLATMERQSGGRYSAEIPSAARPVHKPKWSGDRATYQREWTGPDWSKGYVPGGAPSPVAGGGSMASAGLLKADGTKMVGAGLTKIA